VPEPRYVTFSNHGRAVLFHFFCDSYARAGVMKQEYVTMTAAGFGRVRLPGRSQWTFATFTLTRTMLETWPCSTNTRPSYQTFIVEKAKAINNLARGLLAGHYLRPIKEKAYPFNDHVLHSKYVALFIVSIAFYRTEGYLTINMCVTVLYIYIYIYVYFF